MDSDEEVQIGEVPAWQKDLSAQTPIDGKCIAHRKNGDRCKNAPILGARVCGAHGGRAPQVKRAAALRLAMASDWLMAELLKIAKSAADERTRLAAVNSALDRAGFAAKNTTDLDVRVSGKLTAWEQHVLVVLDRTPPASLPRRQSPSRTLRTPRLWKIPTPQKSCRLRTSSSSVPTASSAKGHALLRHDELGGPTDTDRPARGERNRPTDLRR